MPLGLQLGTRDFDGLTLWGQTSFSLFTKVMWLSRFVVFQGWLVKLKQKVVFTLCPLFFSFFVNFVICQHIWINYWANLLLSHWDMSFFHAASGRPGRNRQTNFTGKKAAVTRKQFLPRVMNTILTKQCVGTQCCFKVSGEGWPPHKAECTSAEPVCCMWVLN